MGKNTFLQIFLFFHIFPFQQMFSPLLTFPFIPFDIIIFEYVCISISTYYFIALYVSAHVVVCICVWEPFRYYQGTAGFHNNDALWLYFVPTCLLCTCSRAYLSSNSSCLRRTRTLICSFSLETWTKNTFIYYVFLNFLLWHGLGLDSSSSPFE